MRIVTNMNEEQLVKLLGIKCNTTCGCGFPLIKYDLQHRDNELLLTCKPFDNTPRYQHPLLLAIDGDSPLIKLYESIIQPTEGPNALVVCNKCGKVLNNCCMMSPDFSLEQQLKSIDYLRKHFEEEHGMEKQNASS